MLHNLDQSDFQESVELHGKHGGIKASGPVAVILLVMVLGFGAIGWMGYASHQEQTAAHAAMAAGQVTMQETAAEQTFFLSLPEADRARYRLNMPGSLRQKLAYSGPNGGR